MKILLPFITIILASFSLINQAQAVVSVNALNYPVWVERDLSIIPLAPGDELLQGDMVKTGQSGRAWLSMQDGSVVKLGQDAQFEISSAEYQQQEENTILKAALNVVKGAFRFTTSFFNPQRKTPHQVNIKIGAITAGIRGTDIWGRSNDEEDFVTLLEGTIEVTAEGEGQAILSEPLSLYLKKRNQPADPVTLVDMDTVQSLGAETELSHDLGTAGIDGKYELVLMSVKDAQSVESVLERFHQQGYAVETVSAEVNDEIYTRIVLKGFDSRATASQAIERIQNELDLNAVWVNNSIF